jgi:hypothetical protein
MIDHISPVDPATDELQNCVAVRREQRIDDEVGTDKAQVIDGMHPGFATDTALTRLAKARRLLALHPRSRHDVTQYP